jgi:BirA family transcriptional regulator, biotin operon repressor / biotin---[acetyl-CoA-carboxylase] ligase
VSSFLVGEKTRHYFKNNFSTENLPLFYEKLTNSTNNWAKEIAFTDKILHSKTALILTDFQTQGRGRNDRTWTTSIEGSSLLCSWIFDLGNSPNPVTSIRIGLALYNSCNSTWPHLKFSIKAPNDLYLNGKKLAGILIENIQQGSKNKLIAGIGLNVFDAPRLPQSATVEATALEQHCQVTSENWLLFLQNLYSELNKAIENSYSVLKKEEIKSVLHALNQNSNLKEKYISLESDGSLVLTNSKIHWRDL